MRGEPLGTRITRRALMAMSRVLFLPWFHHGRGPTPGRWGGSFCVLRTRGRRSGLVREAPLDYAPDGDGILIIAGLGERTFWLRNILADPRVEVRLGDRTIAGTATVIADGEERLRAIRAVMQHCGLVGYVYGFSPFTASDARLARATRDVVAVRIALESPPPPSHLGRPAPA